MSEADKKTVNPSEDYVHMSHLSEYPNLVPGDYVATGSAGLKMGSTGNSTAPHLDLEAGTGAVGDYSQKQGFEQMYPNVMATPVPNPATQPNYDVLKYIQNRAK